MIPHRIGALAAAVFTAGVILSGCGPAANDVTPPAVVQAAAPQEPSLFELGFAMTDQGGRSRRLTDFRGQPFLVAMIYTRCTSVCPRITADLKRIETALEARDRARTRFVLVSLDPEHDTPAALRTFAGTHALDTTRWTLLAATPEDMRTLAAVLDVRFRPDAQDEIAHSAVVAIADGAGVVRRRHVGVVDDPAPLAAAVRALD